MLQQARQMIVQRLWQNYRQGLPQIRVIEAALQAKGIAAFGLDHFAVIDLPGLHTGIPQLAQIFSILGFVKRGQGYLPDKQNEFVWFAENNSHEKLAMDALSQVVVADFHLNEMPIEIKKIIEKYVAFAPPSPLIEIQKLIEQQNLEQLCELVVKYFSGRDWPLPTLAEFKSVQEFNELLAWVLVFGRKPNHFTLSAHLLSGFVDFDAFNQFLIEELKFELNGNGGFIKGNKTVGIEQSSTIGVPVTVSLADGVITLADSFVEFVWRHPKHALQTTPLMWNDYFPGFIGEYANNVIESLYSQQKSI